MDVVLWAGGLSLILLLIWLSLLSYLFAKQNRVFNQLFPKEILKRVQDDGKRGQDNMGVDAFLLIRERFDVLLKAVEEVEKRELAMRRGLKDLGLDGLNHLQRVEVLRYNPYNDTGGDQSFSLVLLDGKLNGLIFSSLHSRAGTRTYIKPVVKGKSELELSKEEKKVLEKVVS
jgi:hypothetical protein